MEHLKNKLLKEFNVELESDDITLDAPTVILKYKQEHNKFINRNPAIYDMGFFRTKAENIAHQQAWTYTFNSIKNVRVLNSNPYEIEIQAVKPLIFAFVLATLGK